jgi:hypothetical protein
MGYTTFYNKAPTSQMKGIMANPNAGLNMYNPSNEIGDNFLADSLDVSPYYDKGMKFEYCGATGNVTSGTGAIVGDVICMSRDNRTAGTRTINEILYLTYAKEYGTDGYIDYLNKLVIGSAVVQVSLSSYNLAYNSTFSMCKYFTQAKAYLAFTCDKVQTLFLYDMTTLTTVTLPFYPVRIVAHANRIFAIDTQNVIWWSRAGDPYTWYSFEQDSDYIVILTDMINGAYSIAASPMNPCYLSFSVTITGTIDTMGTLAIVGTNHNDVAITETIIPIGGVAYSKYAYKTITSITGSGWTSVNGTDKIKIGTSVIAGGFVTEDAGYWSMETESRLMSMAVLSRVLYIWSRTNIFAFQGYSYDTFSLERVIAGIGADVFDESTDALTFVNYGHAKLIDYNNKAYFFFNKNIYEFDGNDYPRLITHPEYANGNVINGIYGGIAKSNGCYNLCGYDNKLYVYDGEVTATTGTLGMQEYMYIYDMETRSWIRRSGQYALATAANDTLNTRLFVYEEGDASVIYCMSTVVLNNDIAGRTTNWYLKTAGYEHYNPSLYPYMTTKFYNDDPSDELALTSIILLMRNLTDADTAAVINVYYKTSMGDSVAWSTLTEKSVTFTNDLQVIDIPLTHSEIARKHHYQLKVEVESSGSTITPVLYGFERRYRVLKRSR